MNTAAASNTVLSAAASAVDLNLVLAVDCSSSVDATDFQMQMDGIAAALRNPLLLEAIASGTHRQIALAMVQWSNWNTQVTALGWRVLASGLQLEMTAREIETAERQWRPGGTGLAAAIGYCTALLQAAPLAADRQTIDVSGDGEDNEGGDAADARDRAVALGITINGLPIIYGSRRLFAYYRDQVIGGAGSFLMPADSIWSFRDTILRKLLREIGRPVS